MDDTQHNDVIRVFGEFRPIRSNLRLRITLIERTVPKTGDISASIGSSGLVISNGRKRKTFVFEDLPLPATTLPFSNSQVELDLALHTSTETWTSVHEFRGQDGDSQARLVERLRQCQCHWHCAACGHSLLLSDRRFERVLPLPSDLWSEQAQHWFCHPPDQSASHSSPESGNPRPMLPLLAPRPGDCLVGPLYLLLPPSFLHPGAAETRGEDLYCQQCGEYLGLLEPAPGGGEEKVMKLYTCSVRLHEEGNETHHFEKESLDSWSPTRLEDFLHDFLKEQSLLYTSFRFLLQPPAPADPGQDAILVWLMDPNLVVFSATDILGEGDTTTSVPRRSALQLLYLTANHCGDADLWRQQRTQWSADSAVHTVAMARPLCRLVAATLDRGNDRLSESLKEANGFRVCILTKQLH